MVYVRFERGRDDVIGPTFGPYEFVQVTYHTLRVGPNGDDLAFMHDDGDWHIVEGVDSPTGEKMFSDFIVYDKEK